MRSAVRSITPTCRTSVSAVTAPSVAALLSPLIPSLLLLADKFQESSSEGLNAACVDAHKGDAGGAWKCIFAQWSSAHIKTPTFPMQSQYDAWQTGNVMGAPDPGTTPAATQNVFGKNLTALVKSQLLCAPLLSPARFLAVLNAAVVFAGSCAGASLSTASSWTAATTTAATGTARRSTAS